MQKKEGFLGAFLLVFLLSIIILIFSENLKFLISFLEKRTSQIQGITFHIFQNLPFSENAKIKELKNENLSLLNKILDEEKLKKENASLLDQFKTSYPPSYQLLEAKVIGAPSFVPGVSSPTTLIIDKGSKDNLKVGQVVILKNNLIGIVAKVSVNLAKVTLTNNPSLSFTAKTENGAIGIIKGNSASLTLGNVLLSENIKNGEMVLTKGDINIDGIGIPEDLIVGKIISVEKNPSDLFQKAKVESFIDFTKLSIVFVYFAK